jgi:hypothetical protein
MHFRCDKCFLSVFLCAAFWNLDKELFFSMDPERDLCVRYSRAIGSNLTALLYGSDSESFKMNTGTGNCCT